MLFSNAEISAFINQNFEPAWESVRPVPMVRIDFGNGTTLTRTLNGNIATYICRADGVVLDVIPGVYDPATYLERLQQAVLLERWVRESSRDPLPALEDYHRQQAQSLRENHEPKIIVSTPGNPAAIVRVEAGLKLVLKSSLRPAFAGHGASHGTFERQPRSVDFNPREPLQSPESLPRGLKPTLRGNPEPAPGGGPASATSAYDLPHAFASRVGKVTPQMLEADSRYNESVRRLKVHEYLADHSPLRPADMTRWLYKDVLETDLDDPYLGLRKVLFASEPFQK
ncbi:MAG: hypothetical protein KY476_16030 [Planctomycetes bacterium]|nr:hypothetical protein [Planctomycetota bacterium]